MQINVDELLYILEKTPADQNILLKGKHGIGKSEIITNYFESLGQKVVPLFIGQMSDAGDIIGLPNKNEETGQTEFMLPFWFPVDGKPIVLFLDELNRARPELMQVVMDLVLNKKIAGKKLPEGSRIISAINNGDEYTLTDMDPALISRFNVYEFVPSVSDWIKWASINGINEYVIDFISSNENLLDCQYEEGDDSQKKTYDRRSWKRVSDVLNSINYDNSLKIQKMICGIIGETAGSKFFQFIVSGKIVKSIDILTDFQSVKDKIENYNVINFMSLCDRLCGFINMEDIRKNKNYNIETCADNMKQFLEFLMKKSRENMAYLVSNYSSGKYPKFNAFIATNYELDNMISKFISSIETI